MGFVLPGPTKFRSKKKHVTSAVDPRGRQRGPKRLRGTMGREQIRRPPKIWFWLPGVADGAAGAQRTPSEDRPPPSRRAGPGFLQTPPSVKEVPENENKSRPTEKKYSLPAGDSKQRGQQESTGGTEPLPNFRVRLSSLGEVQVLLGLGLKKGGHNWHILHEVKGSLGRCLQTQKQELVLLGLKSSPCRRKPRLV